MLLGDAAHLTDVIEPSSVDCVVTSPPYNIGMEYPGVSDSVSLPAYLVRTSQWAEQIAAVLVEGGRVWVNVMPTLPLLDGPGRWSPMANWILSLELAGLEYRDTVVWHQDVADNATAWGSWMSPAAPNQRGRWESILCFYKGSWKRDPGPTLFAPDRLEKSKGYSLDEDGVTSEEFVAWTRNVWPIPPARRNGSHPCPFPDEIVRRCILLSTFPGDLVLDPFAGSGTSLRVAESLRRRAIGVDLSAFYVAQFETNQEVPA